MEIQGADAYDRHCARQQEALEDMIDEGELNCGCCEYCLVCPWDKDTGYCSDTEEFVRTYDIERAKECFE